MSTPDPFEEKLLSLQRRPLPPEWRARILGQACLPRAKGPPRWLACGWGVGIAAAILLSLLTPASSQPKNSPSSGFASSATLQQRTDLLNALLARNDLTSPSLLP